MSRQPRRKDNERERNLPGMPPEEDRQRPGVPEKNKTAWSRGDGGMEGPAGWHSEFGRAGFASTGDRLNEAPKPDNALEAGRPSAQEAAAEPKPKPAPKPENRVRPGAANDGWDRPYGDASWGGQAVKTTPDEDRQANASIETAEARDRQPREREKQ